MALQNKQFAVILYGLEKLLNYTARQYPVYKARLMKKNFIAQIKLQEIAH